MAQSVADVAASIEQSADFEPSRDIRDPWGLSDLARFPELAAETILVRHLTGPLWAEEFPLMRVDGRPRRLTILDPFDNEALRARARDVVVPADSWLSGDVLTNRVYRSGRSWATKPPKGVFQRRRARVLQMFATGSPAGLVTLDVREHYDSIDRSLLRGELEARAAPAAQVDSLFRDLDEVARLANLPGLPTGPEVSGPLSNVDLLPLDEFMDRQGWGRVRVGDDYCVAATRDEDLDRIPHLAAEALATRGERLAEEKVQVFDTASQWLLSNASDASITGQSDEVLAAKGLEDFLESLPSDRAKINREFRELARRRDRGGLERLRQSPWLWDTNGRAIVSYIEALGATGRPAIEDALEALPQRPADTDEAGHLFRLEVLSRRNGGRVEGLVYEKIATSQHWRSPSRALAWLAYSASDAYDAGLATDAALFVHSPIVARAAALSLASEPSDRIRIRSARHIADERPELAVPAAWVQDLR